MENKTITTTNGYTAILKPFLTYDDFVEVQKIWTKSASFDPNGDLTKPVYDKIPMDIMYEANALMLTILVVSITDKDGKVVEREADKLPIPPADGQEIMNAVNVIYKEAADSFSKKKLTE